MFRSTLFTFFVLVAVSFSPSSAYVASFSSNEESFILVPSIDEDVSTFTIETWLFLRHVDEGEKSIYSVFDGNNDNPITFGQDDSSLFLAAPDNDPEKFSFSSAETDEWKHVAVVYNKDSSEILYFVNGEPEVEDTLAVQMAVSLGEAYIGAKGNSTERADYLDGKIDNFRIWKFNLTQSQIQAARYGFVCSDIKSHLALEYLFAEDNGNLAVDTSGNERNSIEASFSTETQNFQRFESTFSPSSSPANVDVTVSFTVPCPTEDLQCAINDQTYPATISGNTVECEIPAPNSESNVTISLKNKVGDILVNAKDFQWAAPLTSANVTRFTVTFENNDVNITRLRNLISSETGVPLNNIKITRASKRNTVLYIDIIPLNPSDVSNLAKYANDVQSFLNDGTALSNAGFQVTEFSVSFINYEFDDETSEPEEPTSEEPTSEDAPTTSAPTSEDPPTTTSAPTTTTTSTPTSTTSPDQAATDDDDDGSNGGAVAAAVIVSILGVLLIATLAYVLITRYQSNKIANDHGIELVAPSKLENAQPQDEEESESEEESTEDDDEDSKSKEEKKDEKEKESESSSSSSSDSKSKSD